MTEPNELPIPLRSATTLSRAVIFITAVALLFAACGGATDITAGDDTGIAPQDPALVETGSDLYQAYCAQCHGTDLRGTDQGPSHLSIVYEPNHHGDGAFVLAIQRGSPAHHWRFGDMEPVDGLGEADITAVIAYVREQQRLNGFEPYPPP